MKCGMETGAERVGLHVFYRNKFWQEELYLQKELTKALAIFIIHHSLKKSLMKNTLILLVALVGSAAASFGQASPKSQQIMQKGNKNVVKVEMNGSQGDTLIAPTRTISQNGDNLIHIESTLPADSLAQAMKNVAVEQQGKGNVVSIKSTGGKGNTVQINQSGSGNSVSIKQN